MIYSQPKFSWKDVVCERLSYIFPELRVELESLNFAACQASLKLQPVSIVVSVLKTWTNVWTTTHRLHCREVFPCVFGCRASPDDLRHYVHCFPLWQAVGRFSPFAIVDGDILSRLALVDFSASDFNTLTAAFHLYNKARSFYEAQRRPLVGPPLSESSRASWNLVWLSRRKGDDIQPIL
jgi:hypothetical protein